MRKRPFATSARSILRAAAILILTSVMVSAQAARRAPKVLGHTAHRSPDRTLVATVVTLKQQHSYGDNPSRVEIRNAAGRLVASKDHSLTGGRDQGFTVEEAAWTPDSRFFVYQVYNSGGHSPWHSPIFFYSRKRSRFYSLDRALEALGHGPGTITGGMELHRPSILLTKGRYYGKSRKGLRTSIESKDHSEEQLLALDLRWLEPRLTRAVEDYYR